MTLIHGMVERDSPKYRSWKWFHRYPARWNEFRRRYFAEPQEDLASWLPILKSVRRCNVTLIYSSHVSEYNHAVAVKEFLIGTENDV